MQQIAQRLDRALERFFVARADGQEFFVLMNGLNNEKACALIERVAQLIAAEPAVWDGHKIAVRFSAGIASRVGNTSAAGFDELVINAYQCLRRAKDAGGDMVLGDENLSDSDQE